MKSDPVKFHVAKRVCVAILLSGTIWCGFYLGRWMAKPSGPFIYIDQNHLDVGDVWVGSKWRRNIDIHNLGESEAEIKDFVASCQCTSVVPRHVTIPPGESRRIYVTVDVNGVITGMRDEDVTAFAIQIQPVVASDYSTAMPETWTFRGSKRSLFRNIDGLVQLPINPEQSDRLGQRSAMLTLEPVLPIAAIHVLEVDEKGVTARSLRGETGYEIEVTFADSLSSGMYTFDVSLCIDLPDGTQIAPAVITCISELTGEFLAEPNSVEFGLMRPGESASVSVWLRASKLGGAGPVEIQPLKALSSYCEIIAGEENSSGATISFNVVAPQEPGFYSDVAKLSIVDPATEINHAIDIPLRLQVVK